MDDDRSNGKPAHEREAGACGPGVSSRYRHRFVLLLPAVLLVVIGVALAQPPDVADLSEEGRPMVTDLISEWREGDVIVLLRHLERCDRADSPCLDGREQGITVRAVHHGYELGRGFKRLGLQNADISNSPLARTAQTSKIVFSREDDQHWLYACREQMLESVMQRKVRGRNLILVTHSGCMEAFQSELGYDDDTPGYGTALFVSEDHANRKLQLLGFLDAEDWDATLGF